MFTGLETKPLILSVETATLAGSVALARGDQFLAGFVGDAVASHSNTLLRDIDKVLNDAQTDLSQIELFAVASGPGSFTGLRIGIATVKALAETLNCPCVGIPTLHAVAHSAGDSEYTVALLPAGRGEVFAQLFSVTKQGIVLALDQASHIAPQRLFEKYSSLEDVLWSGAWASANRALFDDKAAIAPPTGNLAEHISLLALQKFREKLVGHPDDLQAIYVRPSDAELNVP